MAKTALAFSASGGGFCRARPFIKARITSVFLLGTGIAPLTFEFLSLVSEP
jgi:hypothetical protein